MIQGTITIEVKDKEGNVKLSTTMDLDRAMALVSKARYEREKHNNFAEYKEAFKKWSEFCIAFPLLASNLFNDVYEELITLMKEEPEIKGE